MGKLCTRISNSDRCKHLAFFTTCTQKDQTCKVKRLAQALSSTEFEFWFFLRTNVCNDVGDHIWSFQFFEVVHLDNVLLPTPCCPCLDLLEWSILGNWYPQETSL